jgi:carbonic anhydrase/acetyltransferase-like protein (isoleucine patch superfamily)
VLKNNRHGGTHLCGRKRSRKMQYALNGKRPTFGKNVFIAPTAVIIGDVTIRDNASIWYGVVLRGDMEPITIGENTNIQDNCTVHTDYGYPAVLGDNVSVGHNAIVHGCTVEENCLIAINAVVLSGARIRKGSVVAAGSVVREGQEIGPYQLVAGAPAVVKKNLSAEQVEGFGQPVRNYLALARRHLTDLRPF